MSRTLAVLLCLALTQGCAHRSPDAIRLVPGEPVSAEQARSEPGRHDGALVRWGGTIIATDNRADETRVEILSRELDSEGYPDLSAPSGARFIARLPGFHDPAVYARDRLLTVVGHIAGSLEGPIGAFPYRYAVIEADASHLWPDPEPRYRPPPPWPWYDPWYTPWHDPWWPRRRW